MSDVAGIGKASEAAGKLIKPVYEDLAQPAVREVGTFAAQTVRAILLPVRKAMEGYTEVVERLSEKVGEKLKGVPKERLTTPPANIAGPILEAVRFVEPDSPLHEMYANLLAQAMDANTIRDAHPAFVAILGQLSPDEARLLRHLVAHNDTPTITVRDLHPALDPVRGQPWVGKLRNFTLVGEDARCVAPSLATAYLDNLARLGIVEYRSPEQIADEQLYLRLEGSPDVARLRAGIETSAGHSVQIVRGFYSLTTFGRLLLAAAVRPGDAL